MKRFIAFIWASAMAMAAVIMIGFTVSASTPYVTIVADGSVTEIVIGGDEITLSALVENGVAGGYITWGSNSDTLIFPNGNKGDTVTVAAKTHYCGDGAFSSGSVQVWAEYHYKDENESDQVYTQVFNLNILTGTPKFYFEDESITLGIVNGVVSDPQKFTVTLADNGNGGIISEKSSDNDVITVQSHGFDDEGNPCFDVTPVGEGSAYIIVEFRKTTDSTSELLASESIPVNVVSGYQMKPTVLAQDEWSGDTYGLPEFSIVGSWTNPQSLIKYSSLELEYECDNVSEIEFLKLVVHGGNCGWTEIKAIPKENGKIVLDLTDIRDKTFEAALLYVQPIDSYKIGDTFDPKITVTRAEFITEDVDLAFSDKQHTLFICMNSYPDSDGTNKIRNIARNYIDLPQPDGIEYGVTSVGELNGKTFKLNGINFKDCSIDGITASDIWVMFCIQTDDGYDRYFSAVTMNNASLVWTAYFDQGNEIYNNKIVSMGYGLWIENDITAGMGIGETIIVNREEIVNEEHNISVSPVDGNLDGGLTLDVTENSTEDIEVKPEDKETVGKILLAYDIKLMNRTESVQPNCTIRISIPVPEGLNGALLKVYHVQQDGSAVDMNAVYDPETNTISFETSHLSVYVISEDSSVLGDVNGDGELTPRDLTILGKAYMTGTADQYADIADMDDNGKITPKDIAALGKLYMSNQQ